MFQGCIWAKTKRAFSIDPWQNDPAMNEPTMPPSLIGILYPTCAMTRQSNTQDHIALSDSIRTTIKAAEPARVPLSPDFADFYPSKFQTWPAKNCRFGNK